MPELPEVESFRHYMNSTSLNKKISGVEVKSKLMLGGITPQLLQKRLRGKRFKSTKGYGKYLFAETNKGDFLVMHFGMTGSLNYYKNPADASKYIRMQINFDNGYHLAFDDARKLGRIYMANDYKQFIKKKRLGIDPIREKINYSSFDKIINGKKGSVKSILMNQQILAGIGNIYSDEILFHSKIHPGSSFNKLKENELREIFKAMKNVLQKAINKKAEYNHLPDDYLLHFRRPGKDCSICSGKIKRLTIGGRSSYFCSKHQRLIKWTKKK